MFSEKKFNLFHVSHEVSLSFKQLVELYPLLPSKRLGQVPLKILLVLQGEYYKITGKRFCI